MENVTNANPVPGWVGGFEQSNPAFAYPSPDLSSLPLLDNMANIDLLQRQQAVKWPEFSWETRPGHPESRCFQMFAPYISRLGYTNEGRVYSIICPQQGVYLAPIKVTMNIEVTVTGQRGWVDEDDKSIAADMTVVGKIWFSKDIEKITGDGKLLVKAKELFDELPFSKQTAIEVTTHLRGNSEQPVFPVRKGEATLFVSPDFAKHQKDGAWSVGNVEVEIGEIKKTGDAWVDEFNQLVLNIFNFASGNLLKPQNTLSWNVWFEAPTYVDQEEWRTHAERWRKSIDEDHTSPDGDGTSPRYADGSAFNPCLDLFAASEAINDGIRLRNHLKGNNTLAKAMS